LARSKERQLLQQDLKDLKNELAKNPELGDLIVGTGGVRKVRLKSATGGKRGGFRLCYYLLTNRGWLYLLWQRLIQPSSIHAFPPSFIRAFRLGKLRRTRPAWLTMADCVIAFLENEQEDLSSTEKRVLKEFVIFLKGASNV